MIARIKDFVQTREGDSIITLVTRADCAEEIDELKDHDLDVTLKRHRKRRSLNANAYAWVLIGKLAEKLSVPPEEVYREAIRHIAGASDYVCVRESAVETFCAAWRRNGIGWQTEAETSKINGCVTVRVWYGSSTFDTLQMSMLVDLIVQECKQQGITTETPDEIAKMKSLWEEKR